MNQALGREAPAQAHLCDRVVPVGAWPPSPADQAEALSALEQGEVVVLPNLRFDLSHGEEALLDGSVSDGRSKNISFDPAGGRLRGAQGDSERLILIRRMMERFSGW